MHNSIYKLKLVCLVNRPVICVYIRIICILYYVRVFMRVWYNKIVVQKERIKVNIILIMYRINIYRKYSICTRILRRNIADN